MKHVLHDGWTVRAVGGPFPTAVADPIPATVPGTVHTDLLGAGLIEDPYLDDNERKLAWIGLSDWRYEARFDWVPAGFDHVELVFEGLDTVARVELNGQVVASTANQHRTYRVEVSHLLREGANDLAVTFSSAVRYADRASLELGYRPHVNHHPYNAIRKMACNFGWDWGPDVVTAGIWRPVSLHEWSEARLAAVRPVTTVDGESGRVDVHLDLAGSTDDLTVTVEVGETIVSRPWSPVVSVAIPDVALWWPRGHGPQPLYDVVVRLHSGDTTLDEWRGRVGFRTVTVDQHDGSFALVVNGRRVYVKGANWIPDDAFPHRVGRTRYAERLAQAEECGLNLLRVWGGGIYEADAFYDECDERGLLVWQDFLFACAAYEEETLGAEVAAEARDNITRIMPHPSLALWNGNNENLWGHEEWGWRRRLDGKTWGAGYYYDLLPAMVVELDPGRPYTPGSPFSWDRDRHPNDPADATIHIWDVWNSLDYTAYRRYRPRFVAEFGWQGPPAWSTLRRAVRDDPLTPESPGMLVHQKAMEGNVKLTDGLLPHLPLPSTMEDWHWAMALNQARAMSTGVEYFRSLGPHCSGSVVWQLNDCWPVVSWAAVDGDGRRKPVFYALKHAYADRLVTVQPGLTGSGLRVALVNDTASAWHGPLEVTRHSFEGVAIAKASLDVSVEPWSVTQVEVPSALALPDDPASEVLVAEIGGQRGLWWFAEDRDSALPPPSLDARLVRVPEGYQLTVTADVLLRDLALLTDVVDPASVVDDMLVSLLPGESVTWTVRATAALDPARLRDPRVLRCANQLVARRLESR